MGLSREALDAEAKKRAEHWRITNAHKDYVGQKMREGWD